MGSGQTGRAFCPAPAPAWRCARRRFREPGPPAGLVVGWLDGLLLLGVPDTPRARTCSVADPGGFARLTARDGCSARLGWVGSGQAITIARSRACVSAGNQPENGGDLEAAMVLS